MTPEDALRAVRAGADAIVVSNHGGRVLDYGQASIEVLPEIVSALDDRTDILIDGGFRRGTDILKALALGAKAVLVGRPVCWGLAAAGAEGVARILHTLTTELARTMMLTNVPDVNNVPGSVLVSTY
jgi:4-hydroxymandelate oxidase